MEQKHDQELLAEAYEQVLNEMKTYIVYVDGKEVGMIKSGGHNAAEAKAKKKYPNKNVHVVYTEV